MLVIRIIRYFTSLTLGFSKYYYRILMSVIFSYGLHIFYYDLLFDGYGYYNLPS
jgi:hypothetical protein